LWWYSTIGNSNGGNGGSVIIWSMMCMAGNSARVETKEELEMQFFVVVFFLKQNGHMA